MRIDFAGRKWHCRTIKEIKMATHETCGHVYMMTYVKDGERKVAYVGTTENINLRMQSHYVVMAFKANGVQDKLEVLYLKCRYWAYGLESRLIRKFEPPLNGLHRTEYAKSELWQNLGVENPVNPIKKLYTNKEVKQ